VSTKTEKDKGNLISRLNRIEGQVRGIKNMVDEDKFCTDILVQIAAAKSALNSVGIILLESRIQDCVKDAIEKEQDTAIIDDLMEAMKKYIK